MPVWMVCQESLIGPLLVSLALSFSANFKAGANSSPEGKVRQTDVKSKSTEVKDKKKTVSYLINGLNSISGEKLKFQTVCDSWSNLKSLLAKLLQRKGSVALKADILEMSAGWFNTG